MCHRMSLEGLALYGMLPSERRGRRKLRTQSHLFYFDSSHRSEQKAQNRARSRDSINGLETLVMNVIKERDAP